MLMSRNEATRQGLKRYFTGKPCKRGHIAERGVASRACLECVSSASLVWWHQNKQRQLERQHADQKRRNAAARIRRAKNPLKERVWRKAWREKNRDKARLYETRYHAKRPEVTKSKNRNRKARKCAASGSHSAADIAALLRAQRWRCAWCSGRLAKTGYHVDHVLPLVLGGANGRDNLQILCPSCNTSKGAKHPLQFAKEHGRLL